jgi:uncharacterized protein
MTIILSGLLLGLTGSFHCVGMCGPIALSLPLKGNTLTERIGGGLLYNLGRAFTYGLMGVIFGLIGQSFSFFGFQRWISIAMGALMILSIIIPSIYARLSKNAPSPIAGFVRKQIQRFFTARSFSGLFMVGLFNGLLPCGLVYLAIAGAIGTGNVITATLFMFLFGLGTLPMLLFITVLGNIISLSVREKLNKAIPYIVVFIGLIFILRGSNLGIPFLSPPKEKMKVPIHKMTEPPKNLGKAVDSSCCHGHGE